MLPMPDAADLIKEMTENMPLICYSDRRNVETLSRQGVRISEKTPLEVTDVHDLREVSGIMCKINYEPDRIFAIAITGLVFKGNGPIDEKIAAYQKARVAWVEQEEFLKMLGSLQKAARNSPCPCGSGKKYKRCCGG